MRFFLIGFLVICSAQGLLAQRATYFNYDMGLSYHGQKATSTSLGVEGASFAESFVKPMKWREWMWAISIEQEITEHISVQAGLRVQDYTHGVEYDGANLSNPFRGAKYEASTSVSEIPVGLYYNISLVSNLTVAPYVGWVFVPHVGYKADPDAVGVGSATDVLGAEWTTLEYSDTTAPFWGMYEIGARVRYKILEPVSVSAFATWRSPIQEEIGREHVTVLRNGIPVAEARLSNNAQFLSIGIQGSFRLSYLWEK